MELVARHLDNDIRVWILTVVSGIACVFGAAIICVDVFVRLVPGKRSFRIQESNVFLACSLSISFGVMLFSSLYSILPESKEYLKKGGWGDQPAGFLMMACFVGGFVGIQAVSRYLHQHMPSHVVDCDHSHGGNMPSATQSCEPLHRQSRFSRTSRRQSKPGSSRPAAKGDDAHSPDQNGSAGLAEATPLLGAECDRPASIPPGREMTQPCINPGPALRRATTTGGPSLRRRPSMYEVQRRVVFFVKDTMCDCDEAGLCYGFTDPCGQECFKHLSKRSSMASRRLCTNAEPVFPSAAAIFHPSPGHEQQHGCEPLSPLFRTSRAASREPLDGDDEVNGGDAQSPASSVDDAVDAEGQHHHHVPTNAFLSIGLQTSIAIALHKFPEGFITYATNHANPDLGFNVFMALFVHNITEGFAIALPLYMALGSRWRAMLWSSLLGGFSQPMGTALAALWFKLAQRTHLTPNNIAYACLFAATAGIMVSVALQLFVEGLSLNHNRNLCISFGFLGMTLLGVSNALFAAHG